MNRRHMISAAFILVLSCLLLSSCDLLFPADVEKVSVTVYRYGIDQKAVVYEVEKGREVQLPVAGRDCYEFVSATDSAGNKYEPGKTIYPEKDLVIIYDYVKTWEVKVTVDDEQETYTVREDQKFRIPNVEKENYWPDFIDDEERHYKAGEAFFVGEDLDIVCNWRVGIITLTVKSEGSGDVVKTMEIGDSYLVGEKRRDRYVTEGVRDQDGRFYSIGDSVRLQKETVLTYEWKKLYKVTVVSEGVSCDYIVKEGDSFDIQSIRKEGYYAKSIKDQNGKEHMDTRYLAVDSDTVLDYEWQKGYSVRLVGGGMDKVVGSDGSFTVPDIKLDGCYLCGIYDEDGTRRNVGDVLPITHDTEIFWDWVVISTAKNFEYEIVSDGVKLLSHYPDDDVRVIIPDEIEGKPVVELGDGLFYVRGSDPVSGGYNRLSYIVIPDSVKRIGSNTFRGCLYIEKISFSDNLETIGSRAFYGCRHLKSIEIGSNVKSIGTRAFEGCSGLGEITLPEGLLQIQDHAFLGCTGMNTIRIPSTVEEVGIGSFQGWTSEQTIERKKNTAGWSTSWNLGSSAKETIF